MYGYIYKTTNTVNGKIYIGQHKSEKFDYSYIGSGKIFKSAVRSYGRDKFVCEVLCWCDSREQMNEMEKYYIQEYGAKNKDIGYNISDGGYDFASGYHIGMLGKKQSEHQKMCVSKALTGVKKSDEACRNMSIAKIGNSNGAGGIGKKFIHRGNEQIRVYESEFDKYLSEGWEIGKRPWTEEAKQQYRDKYKNGSYMHKGHEVIFVHNTEIDSHLSNGWELGKRCK